MQTSIYNQQEPYVYLWRDRLLNRYYLGYHNGSNPNYVCSSKPMMEEYKARPEDFTRRILATGTQEEMAVLERELLLKRKKHLGERYYNIMIPKEKGFPIIKWTDDIRKKMSIARKGIKLSEETKRKISIAKKGKKGKKFSEEHKRKISESTKKAWTDDRRPRKHSEETKRKISIAKKKRNETLGVNL